MNIIGLDMLTFGVDDLEAAAQFLKDYGLTETERGAHGGTYVAADGTGLIIRKSTDPSLPVAVAPSPTCRDTLYGVADEATLEAIRAELSKDREVKSLPDGIIRSTDEDGYSISFRVTRRHPPQVPVVGINVPYQSPGRAPNVCASLNEVIPKPLKLSHLVYFSKDAARARKFYTERLGFRTNDMYGNPGEAGELGYFMSPAGTLQHHTMFLVNLGCCGIQHFTFDFAGAYEVFKAGWEFQNKGYKCYWGPGRHVLGSNYFWYFYSPFGCPMEMDADMDNHDKNWTPRRVPLNEDTTQSFVASFHEKYVPHIKE